MSVDTQSGFLLSSVPFLSFTCRSYLTVSQTLTANKHNIGTPY